MQFLLFLVQFAFKVSICFRSRGSKCFFHCQKRKDVDYLEEEVTVNAVEEAPAASETLIPEDPQRFYSTFLADDYVITIVHDITLGDVLVSTLLCVLIISHVLGRVIGGVR